jgi:putative transposase
VAQNAEILIQTLSHYRASGAYQLHQFVVMPDHLHLLLTPSANTSLEKAIQLIKGGSSHAIHTQRQCQSLIWQEGFYDWTIRDADDWEAKVAYIRLNLVKAGLVAKPEDWPYSSANGQPLDRSPDRYRTFTGAEAPAFSSADTPGLKPRPPKAYRA